jgi:transposase
MYCLRNSPDFNPIENLWSGMKMELKDDHISEEAGTLHAQKAEDLHGQQGANDQILVI